MTGPIREPGWWRITAAEPVSEDQALDEIDMGKGEDLILVKDITPGTPYVSSS